MARNKVDLPEPEGRESKVLVPASIVSRLTETITRPSGRHNARSRNTRSRPKCSVRSIRGDFLPSPRAASIAKRNVVSRSTTALYDASDRQPQNAQAWNRSRKAGQEGGDLSGKLKLLPPGLRPGHLPLISHTSRRGQGDLLPPGKQRGRGRAR